MHILDVVRNVSIIFRLYRAEMCIFFMVSARYRRKSFCYYVESQLSIVKVNHPMLFQIEYRSNIRYEQVGRR